jgi:putative ABC transport system permease protein
VLSYAARDLLRNPGRTLAAFAGVALAVALVAATAFFVDASAARMTQRSIAPVAIDMQAVLTTPLATGPGTLSIQDLSSRVLKVPGVQSADTLGGVDLAPGSLHGGGTVLGQPLRVMALNPEYLQHYQLITVASGRYTADSVLLSADAASALGVTPGQTIALTVPGRPAPITATVGGVADFSHADPLFVSRSPDTQGEVAPVPNVIVLPLSMFENTILPALRVDATSATPQLRSGPYLELDLHVDRTRLNSDPTVAVVSTQGLKRAIERTAPGQVGVIDNLSDSLTAARGDTILAKILFLFLGLPGVLLAAYLSRYAGGLLAEAQRRERGILRARGAQPRHLLSALTYTTVAVAVIGAAIGLAIGIVVVAVMLGPAALQTASVDSLAVSAAAAVGAGLLTTALALYVPGRRALYREANEERRELEVSSAPIWLRMRIDLVLLAAAALVWFITVVAGGFKPTTAEGQSVSLSFYTLLAPMLGWLGATLLAVRLLLLAGRRLSSGKTRPFKGAASGVLRRSIQRRSLPLASAVIAVGLAVGFGSSLALLVSTYDAEKSADARFVVGSDIRVTPSAAVPQQSAFASRLLVPGVNAVTPIAQTSSAIVGTDKRALVAIDPASFARVASLPDSFLSGISSRDAMAALQSDHAAVLISNEMARTFNVQTGDQVRVQLPGSGGKPVAVTFHAAGTFINFPGFPQGIDMVGNLSFYQNATGSQRADLFLVNTADPSADAVTRTAQALRANAGPANPVLIDTTATAINRDASSLTALNMRGLGSLEALFAVLMSAIGIAIFVFGLLLQRRKEFVTMRALGMGLRQLRALVAGEAAIVASFSLVIGGLVGAAMALMFVQVLKPLFTIQPTGLAVPVGELVLLATLVLGGVGLSTLISGRILRRLNPAELLREE